MARDPERGCGSLGNEHQRKGIEWSRTFHQMRILKAEGPLSRNEYVVDREIVTAGAAQAGRVPGIENLALGEPQKTSARLWNPGRAHMRSAIIDDITADPHPFAVLTTAGERKTAVHPIAAADRRCLTGGGGGRRGRDPDVGIHLAGDALVEKSGNVSAVASDHRAPAGRAFRHGDGLYHANLSQRIEFGRTPRAWQHHSKDAGVFHGLREAWRDSPHLLHLVAGGTNLWS